MTRILVTFLLIVGFVTPACVATEETVSDQPLVSAAQPKEPWRIVDAAPNVSDELRVLVLHDMEGLSGQDDWKSFDYPRPEYPHGQELLVADINAVVDGLFAGGATEVHIVDGHGSGNPEPDVRADLLDPRASQILRDEPFDTYFDMPESSMYDAVVVVGMHAKTGSGGFASHTFTLGIEFQINGHPITETELVGLSWGRVGVPVVFASGDDRLGNDLETMPWIQYVTVKTATSAMTADLRPVDEARADLTAGARQAVDNLASAKVMRVSTPVHATLQAVPPASLRSLEGFPGIDYSDNSVSFMAADLREAYDGLTAIVQVARTAYPQVMFELLRGKPNAQATFDEYSTRLTERWLDFESGRWQPPEDVTGPELRQYHGYR